MTNGELLNYSAGSRAIARNPRLEINLPPRAGSDQPHAEPGGVWQFVPAFFACESAREIFACASFLLCWINFVSPFRRTRRDRRPVDVLLPPGSPAGVPRHEGPALCRFEWRVSA